MGRFGLGTPQRLCRQGALRTILNSDATGRPRRVPAAQASCSKQTSVQSSGFARRRSRRVPRLDAGPGKEPLARPQAGPPPQAQPQEGTLVANSIFPAVRAQPNAALAAAAPERELSSPRGRPSQENLSAPHAGPRTPPSCAAQARESMATQPQG